MSLRKSNGGRGGTAATDTGSMYHGRYHGVKTPRDRISDGNVKCQGMSGRRWTGGVDSDFSQNAIGLAVVSSSAGLLERGRCRRRIGLSCSRLLHAAAVCKRRTCIQLRRTRARNARSGDPKQGQATSGARIDEGPTRVGRRYMGPSTEFENH